MFLSNTATTALMVQIVKVILAELELGDSRQNRAAQEREDLENSSDNLLQQGETVFASTSENPARQSTISDVNSSREVLKEYSRYVLLVLKVSLLSSYMLLAISILSLLTTTESLPSEDFTIGELITYSDGLSITYPVCFIAF